MSIYTKNSLQNLLLNHNIPIQEWETGGAKSIRNLLIEISKGETILKNINGSLIREVKALSIVITYRDLVLKEDRQKFIDGRVRRRKMMASVAEKLDKNDKDLMSAVVRGIEEELGFVIDKNQIIEKESETKERISDSYPGLMTHIKLYRFLVDLKDHQFNSDGYEEFQEDKTTYFKWVPK